MTFNFNEKVAVWLNGCLHEGVIVAISTDTSIIDKILYRVKVCGASIPIWCSEERLRKQGETEEDERVKVFIDEEDRWTTGVLTYINFSNTSPFEVLLDEPILIPCEDQINYYWSPVVKGLNA